MHEEKKKYKELKNPQFPLSETDFVFLQRHTVLGVEQQRGRGD
jgi:hypothetical protein